ncbi:MAG: DNA methyltransferase [Fusobacteria bacterium]|nr:DNA methyltransferase [Fusobacteriota bacterium]
MTNSTEQSRADEVVNPKLSLLKKEFPEVFDVSGNFNLEKFQEILDSNTKFFNEAYGLNFLGKSYARHLANLEPRTHISEERKVESENIYIKGDNLEVLRHLNLAYKEQVKMIYIDPPYNTQNGDFVYNDDRRLSERELSKLVVSGIIKEDEKERILKWEGKSNTHSAWLTFMYPRLVLARRLLKDDGVIFISIDDNEQAQLKLLCDEIFGEENFVAEIIRKTKSMTGDEGCGINMQHELLFCFSKIKTEVFLEGELKTFDDYSNPDNDENGEWTSGDPSAKSGGETTYFEIINPYTGKVDYPPRGRFWAFSKKSLEEYIKNGKILFKKNHKKNYRGFIFKRYKNELQTTFNPVSTLFSADNEYLNQVGTRELQEIFGDELFSNPKPAQFVKKLIQYSSSGNSNSSDLILDFFSGSATTAHAVNQLNLEVYKNTGKMGSRKWIMVQLEEEIDKSKPAYSFCIDNNLPTNITSIGIERIKRANKKMIEEFSVTDEKVIDQLDFSVYKVEEKLQSLDEESLKAFSPTLNFDTGEVLTETQKRDIVHTFKLQDGCSLSASIEEYIFNWEQEVFGKLANISYQAYKVGEVLYLIDTISSSFVVKALLERIDEEREFNITRVVLYGFSGTESRYFMELQENIENYNNKKSATIKMEVRR